MFFFSNLTYFDYIQLQLGQFFTTSWNSFQIQLNLEKLIFLGRKLQTRKLEPFSSHNIGQVSKQQIIVFIFSKNNI